MIHILAFNAAFMCCLAYTFMRGGGPEKTAMLLQACALIITIGAIHFLPRSANFTGLALRRRSRPAILPCCSLS